MKAYSHVVCGRFTLTVPSYEVLAEALGVPVAPALAAIYRPRFNVAPSDDALILRATGGRRELAFAGWGLAPERAGGPPGPRPINARAETLEAQPLFRGAFEHERCAVVTDGFYEWERDGSARRPVWIAPQGGGLLLLAGLVRATTPSGGLRSPRPAARGPTPTTFAIVTTAANAEMAWLHDRMPLVLSGPALDAWLDETRPSRAVRDLLKPPASGRLRFQPVSERVSSVKHDDPACLAPRETTGVTATLFDLGPPSSRRR